VARDSAGTLRRGLQLAHWTSTDLWVAALAIGGNFSQREVQQVISGHQTATPIEHDILATALNEHLSDRGHDQPVTYWRDLHPAS
jgi:hypothetical protein